MAAVYGDRMRRNAAIRSLRDDVELYLDVAGALVMSVDLLIDTADEATPVDEIERLNEIGTHLTQSEHWLRLAMGELAPMRKRGWRKRHGV